MASEVVDHQSGVNASRLNIKNFVGFPELGEVQNVKVATMEFLNAAKEVVSAIENFGKIFSPVVYDMQKNIEKITSVYEKNKVKYEILEEMLRDEKSGCSIYAGNALLWLYRALVLISVYFYNIVTDEKESNNLKDSLKDAYDKTLKPYHGWILQNTFALVYRWIPTRAELFGTGPIYAENMEHLQTYQKKMHSYLQQIKALIISYDLDDQNKV